ncbi:Ribulose-1,5 bisphosphate carboxylase/oxygenase large subunit N-methyltransferase, chloroplastic [Galdieria sulphuraria]|uniref:[ribulose-bisphosphate carboxylase]-lysine N-methyltransferase n=1 Tax=Galdieria sulphuraria TaxID=130081 RepID=M2X4A7_GALSU|nr:[ribulose-bisphosphate carboxylase]-lysine N-methyltransferase [Galdieria sulphuraria]EME31265.1 [ribulose-bisphosphate carboxylase]-lysine N-methyltransferase [Galdieria sulphuraria]GJD07686.1 Ribulose-1,5 bisphosphate carboxylase/oxygenase large subunit N-methyltransferase, chloroplastic [Galdieria sulphuraria]|eukprot:XP_005707785.1 [ribulose-bisphosphate carboxylase]-lysine N-methyltransferase [Galdieria sulphuraria]
MNFVAFYNKVTLVDCRCRNSTYTANNVQRTSLYGIPRGYRVSKTMRPQFFYVLRKKIRSSTWWRIKATFLEKTEELENWLFDNGVPSIKGKPVLSPHNCRTFRAKIPLKLGEEVLAIPERFWLTKQLSEKLLGFHVSDLSDEEAIAALLLVETARKETSFWKPWIETLPSSDELHHFLVWSTAETQYLESSSTFEDILSLRETASLVFEELNTELFPKFLYPQYDVKYFTLPYFTWALSIVQSFGLYDIMDSCPLVIVPGLEWLTYKYSLITEESFFRQYFHISNVSLIRVGPFFTQERRLKITASEDLKVGEPVSLVYEGNVSLIDTFCRWGWKLDLGALDEEQLLKMGSYEISFAVTTTDQFFDDKEDILDAQRLELLQTFELRYDMSKELLQRILPFLRLICLKDKDSFILESVFRSEVWSHLQLPFSYNNEKAVCELVIQTCEESLERWHPVSLEIIERGMKDSPEIRKKMVSIIKWMEEAVLKRTIEYFERYLAGLEQIEYYQERRLRQLDLLRPLDSSERVGQPPSEGNAAERPFDQYYL